MGEPFNVPVIRIISESGQSLAYFSFQMLSHWALGSLTHLHQSLAPRALLRISGLSKPRPPWFLGLQTFSQETKAHFFLVSSFPHKKSRWIFWNYCKTPNGAGRVDSMKIGIAWRTALVRTSLPAKLKYLFVHFLTLSWILVINGSHILLFQGLAISGAPKYLEGRDSLWKPEILDTFLWMGLWVLKKKNFDLVGLTSIP